jgi:3-oxoacyl-[acyl-carrier-protein] synthase III
MVVEAGAGLWAPEKALTNVELVQVLNDYADRFNEQHASQIDTGDVDPVAKLDPDFITKASGIRQRFVSHAYDSDPFAADKLFHQEGRKVFKEVCPMAAEHLAAQIDAVGASIGEVRRWWLHQANINMNQLITKRLLGHVGTQDEAPIVLDEYANTASAGSMIAFNLHHKDLSSGDLGVICSFGAGYSIGSLALRKR